MPEPDEGDDGSVAAKKRRELEETLKREALARQARAEAEAAIDKLAADRIREEEKAAADHRLALAEAARKEAEERSKTEAIERTRATAGSTAALDDRKRTAEARKAIVEAQAGAVKALLPDEATLKPLEGKVTADDKSGVIATTAAYTLLTHAADRFVAELSDPAPEGGSKSSWRVLVIDNRDLVAADWAYHAVTGQIRALAAALDAVRQQFPEPEQPAKDEPFTETAAKLFLTMLEPTTAATTAAALAGALPRIVGAAADVAGYFASDYDIKGRDVDIPTDPAVTTIAGALARAGVTTVIDGLHVLPSGPIFTEFHDLLVARWKLTGARLRRQHGELAVAAADVQRAAKAFEAAEKDHKAAKKADPPNDAALADAATAETEARRALAAAELEHGRIEAVVAAATKLETKVDDFATAVTTAPADGGLPPLANAAWRSALHAQGETSNAEEKDGGSSASQAHAERITHVLAVSLHGAGGETHVRQRRFLAPVLRYVGTCTVAFTLAAVDGKVHRSATYPLIAQLEYRIKKGELGALKRIELG